MKLELEDGTVIERPSEHDIEQALDTLGRHGNSFAILSQEMMTYVQTAGARDSGYDLEYQEEDTEHHYRVPELVSHDAVVSVFKRYARGDDSWKTEFAWERKEVGSGGSSGCLNVVLLVLVLVLVVARLAV